MLGTTGGEAVTTVDWIDAYNVVWEKPSRNSGESMPCGGHDIGMNIWVEEGDLLFYFDRSGSFDENHQMLKLGRVRVQLDPNPFAANKPFRQTLRLRQGDVEIVAGRPEVRFRIWVEAFRPVIHVEMESESPVNCRAVYESWRLEKREVPQKYAHAVISMRQYDKPVFTWPDVVSFDGDGVLFYHRNRDEDLLIDKLIAQQQLQAVADQIPNTQKGRIFGGYMSGHGLFAAEATNGCYIKTPYRGWALASRDAARQHSFTIACHTAQTPTMEQWRSDLRHLSSKEGAKEQAEKWWTQFWERGRICINGRQNNPSDPAWQVGRNYQLFRYMLGCNALGDYPSKFNGSLFTFDACHIRGSMNSLSEEDLNQLSPDFRRWGGGSFTGQNQRLLYWPMLKNGDFDLMPPQFDFYRRGLPGAEARVRHYWGHGGCCFTEQLENFGLPFGWGYGWPNGDEAHKRTADLESGVQAGKWVRYHYDSQVEFALMVLEYHRFSSAAIERWMPFIRSVVRFFDEHYRFRCKQAIGGEFGPDGRYVFAPSTALETFKNVRNPLTVVTGLRVLLAGLQALPANLVGEQERRFYAGMASRLPEIPTRQANGHWIFAPGERFDAEAINSEDPQLYGVFPYPVALPGNAWWQVAQDTWDHDDLKNRFRPCWGQTGIWAARLGRTAEAESLVVEKMQDSGRRFPAFWGPGPDWVPDLDHGGAGMIALQEMLMQTDGRRILLLPSWPKGWDVHFKLYAPGNTTVEAEVRSARLIRVTVLPESRRSDIQVAEDWQTADTAQDKA